VKPKPRIVPNQKIAAINPAQFKVSLNWGQQLNTQGASHRQTDRPRSPKPIYQLAKADFLPIGIISCIGAISIASLKILKAIRQKEA
jgi:hypothetical protein